MTTRAPSEHNRRMEPPLEGNGEATGLRERKKAKTRAAIQQHALRLFREKGYGETTVEEIAEAAEVSPSTFFRYFGTKEEVALYDFLDPFIIPAFRAQPPELNPIQALRAAFRQVFEKLPPEELTRQWERGKLIIGVPELRMRMLDEMARTVQMASVMIGERVGRPPTDLPVIALAGAVIGVAMSTMIGAIDDPTIDFFDRIDAGLALLEAGLPI